MNANGQQNEYSVKFLILLFSSLDLQIILVAVLKNIYM